MNNEQENIEITESASQEEGHRYQKGEILSFIRVRFPGHAKSYPFLVGKRKLMYGQKVVAMSDRGMAVGYINSFVYNLPFEPSMLPLRSINKIATEEDIIQEKENYKRQKEVETICQNLITKHELDMNLTHVEFTQFGKKAVFYFVAPARVDFRNLVKDLVADLKLRIELRQISVRDRSASVGSVGPCGRELCCSSFLSEYGNVSVKMAKNQNLTLNYSKLNGVCGQLKCCLQYEDEVYSQKRRKLPREGELVVTHNGDMGEVRRLHLLIEQFDLLTTEGKFRRYSVSQFKNPAPQGSRMPTHFDNVSDETSVVIGLNEYQAKKSEAFEKELQGLQAKTKRKADEIYAELMGEELPPQKEEERPLREERVDSVETKAEVSQEAKPQREHRPRHNHQRRRRNHPPRNNNQKE